MVKRTFGDTPREPRFDTYYAAIDADNAWQAALDAAGVERYSVAAHGAENSELRRLYEAKIAADEAWREGMGQRRQTD